MKAAAAVLLTLCCAAMPGLAQTQPPLDPKNVLTWPRAPVDKFGCMLERDFETRDAKFNCSLRNYMHVSNVCDPDSPYYEGPEFPAGKASKVLEQFEDVRVAHEHGEVQSVTVVLKQRLTQTAIRALLGLPASPRAALPPNIVSIDIQGCRPDGASQICNVALIQGFDHMGAGDVDCGEEEVRPEPTPPPTAAPQPEKE
jgi:hypothetical protein